jgi:hypothetical protein
MTNFKNSFIFIGLSVSAYLSPILMIISIMTNRWLFSTEKVANGERNYMNSQIAAKNDLTKMQAGGNVSSATEPTPILPLDYIEAAYGLWQMCRIVGKQH